MPCHYHYQLLHLPTPPQLLGLTSFPTMKRQARETISRTGPALFSLLVSSISTLYHIILIHYFLYLNLLMHNLISIMSNHYLLSIDTDNHEQSYILAAAMCLSSHIFCLIINYKPNFSLGLLFINTCTNTSNILLGSLRYLTLKSYCCHTYTVTYTSAKIVYCVHSTKSTLLSLITGNKYTTLVTPP